MGDRALVVDYKYCTNCHACEVSCRNEKGFPLEEWGIKVMEMGPAKLDGKWYWNYVAVPSSLCDGCSDRIANGQDAACVHHCLAQCLELVSTEEALGKLAKLGKYAAVFNI